MILCKCDVHVNCISVSKVYAQGSEWLPHIHVDRVHVCVCVCVHVRMCVCVYLLCIGVGPRMQGSFNS